MINFKTNFKRENFMKFGKILKSYFLSFALILTAQQTAAAQENKSAQETPPQNKQMAQAGLKTATLAKQTSVKTAKSGRQAKSKRRSHKAHGRLAQDRKI